MVKKCWWVWCKFSQWKESPIGYILEVELEYRDELHVLHNDYPLAPEKVAIPYDMLSNYCKKIADEYGIKVGDVKKLISYRNLQLYLSLGMRLRPIEC